MTTTFNSRFYALIALFSLALAASTGVLLRFSLVYGFPSWAQNYTAIRHAHSHLMYFGWGTLGLMALIWHRLPALTGRPLPRGVGVQMTAAAILSLLSFPAFWANGYGLTQIGQAQLPLGSMAAALNGLPWLAFVALYMRATWKLPARPLPVQLWDWGLALLMAAMAGALGLGMQVALRVNNPLLHDAALHLFLDLFASGWFTLATLGLLWAWVQQQAPLPAAELALFLAPTFVLGMSPITTPALAFWLAAVANLGAAWFLIQHMVALWRARSRLPALAWFALAALAVTVATAPVLLAPGVWQWAAGTQLRVYYLHDLLLGWMSSALLGLLLAEFRPWTIAATRWLSWLWMIGVATMVAALLLIGFIQFSPLSGALLFKIAAYSSLAPAAAAIITLLGMGASRRN